MKPWETYEPHKDSKRYGTTLKFKHSTLTPLRAIRVKCVDCPAGHVKEARECQCGTDGTQPACPIWPFRMGRRAKEGGSRVKAIRQVCLQCMNETPSEEGHQHFIRECGDRTCPLLQFRFGTIPSRKGVGGRDSQGMASARAAKKKGMPD